MKIEPKEPQVMIGYMIFTADGISRPETLDGSRKESWRRFTRINTERREWWKEKGYRCHKVRIEVVK